MRFDSRDCAVDTSVAAKLFLSEEGSDNSSEFFALLDSDNPPRFFVQDFFYIELANVVWKCTRRNLLTPAEGSAAIQRVQRLRLNVIPDSVLCEKALLIAQRLGTSVYDAAYLAVSQLIDGPLVTADEKLVARARSAGMNVLSIESLSFAP